MYKVGSGEKGYDGVVVVGVERVRVSLRMPPKSLPNDRIWMS